MYNVVILDVLSTLKRVANVRYVLPEGLSHESKDLINRILQKDVKKRLKLIQIQNHPFLLKRQMNDRINSSRNSCTVCKKNIYLLEYYLRFDSH